MEKNQYLFSDDYDIMLEETSFIQALHTIIPHFAW